MRYMKELENFFDYRKRILDDFPESDTYIIYGLGGNYRFFKRMTKVKIAFGVDKNFSRYKDKEPFEIYSPEQFFQKKNENIKIIITPSGSMYDEIVAMLNKHGINETQYCSYVELLSIWCGKGQKTYIQSVNLFLTNYCTLNCKACSQFTPYLKKKFFVEYEKIITNIDDFFSSVDYVNDFILVGGETFLYSRIGDVCDYIVENYRNRFNKIKIFTNGTLIPSATMLRSLKKECIDIYISDYSNVAPEKSKINDLIICLRENEISFYLNETFGQTEKSHEWFDLGDPRKEKDNNIEKIKEKFSKCSLTCMNLYDSKLFYCVPLWAAYSGDIFKKISRYDYVDLNEVKKYNKEKKVEIFYRFLLGDLQKGYVSFCRNCNGYGNFINLNKVAAGAQD